MGRRVQIEEEKAALEAVQVAVQMEEEEQETAAQAGSTVYLVNYNFKGVVVLLAMNARAADKARVDYFIERQYYVATVF